MKTGKLPFLTLFLFFVPLFLNAPFSANLASAGQAPIAGTWVAKNPPQFGGEILAITLQINSDDTILETAETKDGQETQEYSYAVQGKKLFILQSDLPFSIKDAIGMPFTLKGNTLALVMDEQEDPIVFTRTGKPQADNKPAEPPPVPVKTTTAPPAQASDLTGRWTSTNLKDGRTLTLDFIDATTLDLITIKDGKTQHRKGDFSVKENTLILRSPKGREIEFPFSRRGDRIRMIYNDERIELQLEVGEDNPDGDDNNPW